MTDIEHSTSTSNEEELNFREHAKLIETKIARVVGILHKRKYFLLKIARLKLYNLNALNQHHLIYELLL